MPWVRFDDQFTIHRKVSSLSDAAYRLHTEAIFWCARNLTDGRIARDELRSVSGIGKPDGHAAELVRRGLWIDTGDGWEIHDYLSYQPSRSKVLRDREVKKAAGKLGGVASGQSRRGEKPAGQKQSRSKTEAKPKQDASRLVEHPYLLPSTKEEGVARPPAARGGAGDDPRTSPLRSPPSAAGRPPDLSAVRAKLRADSAKHRATGNRRAGHAFDELRELTTPPSAAPDPEGVTT